MSELCHSELVFLVGNVLVVSKLLWGAPIKNSYSKMGSYRAKFKERRSEEEFIISIAFKVLFNDAFRDIFL